MVRRLPMFAAATALVACTAGSDIGKSNTAVQYASAQADWSQFPDGYQCMVAVQIFYPNAFGASAGIAGNYWSGDCAPEGACHIWYDDVPDGAVWERIPNDGSQSPSTYDMIVFGPTSTNPYGHIASVDHVDSGNVYVMDDNYNLDERKASEPHTVSRAALGWYHLRSLPKTGGGGGGGGSGGWCPNDGMYCGGDYIQGDANTLYQCSGHTLYVSQQCGSGCQWNPVGVDDACKAAPQPASTWCPNDGLYCGGDYVQGDPNTLYQCSGHTLYVSQQCGSGCQWNPVGVDDACKSAAVSTWCPNDGLYCGGDYIQGDPSTLYVCSSHQLSVYEVCSSGCAVQPEWYNDYCN